MPTKTTRSLIKFGTGRGLAVTIPRAWADYYKLKPGDKVTVIAADELVIIRPREEQHAMVQADKKAEP